MTMKLLWQSDQLTEVKYIRAAASMSIVQQTSITFCRCSSLPIWIKSERLYAPLWINKNINENCKHLLMQPIYVWKSSAVVCCFDNSELSVSQTAPLGTNSSDRNNNRWFWNKTMKTNVTQSLFSKYVNKFFFYFLWTLNEPKSKQMLFECDIRI